MRVDAAQLQIKRTLVDDIDIEAGQVRQHLRQHHLGADPGHLQPEIHAVLGRARRIHHLDHAVGPAHLIERDQVVDRLERRVLLLVGVRVLDAALRTVQTFGDLDEAVVPAAGGFFNISRDPLSVQFGQLLAVRHLQSDM